MRLPTLSQPVSRGIGAHRTRGGIHPSVCVSATCTASGQCCASIPVIGQFCIPNPLPVGGKAECCLKFGFPPKVCCSLNGHQIGCFP